MIVYVIFSRSTVGVTGAGRSVDSALEQKKPEARKMLENTARPSDSPQRPVHALLTAIFARNSLKSSHLTPLNSIRGRKS